MFTFVFKLNYMGIYYLLKIKGKAKIPDYVQLRDEKFSLLAYFRLDRPEKSLTKVGLAEQESYIMEFLEEIPFGKVCKIELN
ncbi:MAG: fructose-6-phosphate aldolase [Bacteroidota bacterium]